MREAEGAVDPLLSEQVFQFGRYLMIAGSRPGSQPLNLQGIWNGNLNPPWCSKYTININIQMNYWVAEVCNLSECHEPLLRMVEELQAPGARPQRRTTMRKAGWRIIIPTSGVARLRLMVRSGACGRPAGHGSACISGSTISIPAILNIWKRPIPS